MRQESRQDRTVTLPTVHGYHQDRIYGDPESYACMGFQSNKYYTSDRYIKLTDTWQRTDGKDLKAYGLEIESECWGIATEAAYAATLHKIIFPLFPADLFKLQRDSTLTGGSSSAEIISQTMTKEFIRNNYNAFKLMFNTWFPAYGINCARSGNCGMHVNISVGLFGTTDKTRADGVRKLFYIINKHYDLMRVLLYRQAGRTRWCARMDYTGARTLDVHNMPSSHGNCFNGSHYDAGRVEIRLVGGHDTFAAFRNTMESIFWLVDRVKTLSWADADDVVKIFAGCNNYVYDRLTRCNNQGVLTLDNLHAIQQTVTQVNYI